MFTGLTVQFSGIGLFTPPYIWKVDPASSPATLDLNDEIAYGRKPKSAKAIYKLDGDSLTIAVHHLPLYGVPGNDKLAGRPAEFGGKDVLVLTFERDKAEKADFERLVGRWRSIGGKDYKVIEFREQPHYGLLIAENAKHEADWFSWNIDERKNPREIDVSARVEGASIPNRGIYKFVGERLEIYLGADLQFQGDPGKHTRPEAFQNDVIPGVNYLVLEREMIAWGKPLANGLQFGVLAEPNGRAKVDFGDSVEFQLFVRNTTNKAIDVDLPMADGLPAGWVATIKDRAGVECRVSQQMPPAGVAISPSRLKLKMLDYHVAKLGAVKIRFIERSEARTTAYPVGSVPVSPGEHTIQFSANPTWRTEGSTGELKLNVDSQIAWGPVADGLQFGLKPEKDEYTIGDNVKFTVHARNMSDKELTFMFPTLHGYWPNNGTPIIKDSDGKDVKPHLAEPPGPIGPQAVTKHTLKVGESSEVTSVWWIFVNRAPPRPVQGRLRRD